MTDFRVPPKTTDGRVINAVEKPDHTRSYYFSHNWCDPTTWYGDSILVINEVAENTGDNKNYQLDHYNIIDTFHGKIFGEDFLGDADGYDYRVHVKINSQECVEHDPHYIDHSDEYDYVIDYPNAKITFAYELQPDDEVTVTYHYENGSTFYAVVPSGKKLLIDSSEVQFSDDVNPTDTIKYQVFVYNPYYPQYGPLKVPYGNPNVYKTMSDFQVEAVKTYPVFPAVGEEGNWRGMKRPIIVLNWDYVSGTALRSSYGTEIRIWLEHNKPFEGTYASLTFYGIEQAE